MSNAKKGKPSPRKGVKLSLETRLKLSLAHKGNPSSLKGTHLTEEHKRKIRETKQLKQTIREVVTH